MLASNEPEQLQAFHKSLKQKLQGKDQRLERYTKRSERYKQNKIFREDAEQFYRELEKKTIQVHRPPKLDRPINPGKNILKLEVKLIENT